MRVTVRRARASCTTHSGLSRNSSRGFPFAKHGANSTTHSMLSGAHLHLLVNHAPVFGSLFALVLLIASYFTSPDIFRRTAFVLLIATAVVAAAADLSGQAAEDAIRGFPGVRREIIHAHEQMGDKAYYLAIVLGVLALVALIRWRRRPIPASATLV